MPYLLGQQPVGRPSRPRLFAGGGVVVHRSDAVTIRRSVPRPVGRLRLRTSCRGPDGKLAVQGPTADRIRAALDKPFTYDGKTAQLDDVVLALKNAFEKDNPGLLINVNSIAQVER